MTVMLYLAACLLCFGIAWGMTGAPRNLSIGGRFEAAIADAAEHARSSGTGKLELWSFAELPWTEMYVFRPNTRRERIVKLVGPDIAAAGSEIPASVGRAVTLLVFVNGKRIADVADLPASTADFSRLAESCPLTPDDVLLVNASAKVSAPHDRRPTC